MPKPPKAGKSISPARAGGRPSSSASSKSATPKLKSSSTSAGTKSSTAAVGSNNNKNQMDDLPPPVGYLVTSDIPTKQFILHLNATTEHNDKKFVQEDLDSTHLLVTEKSKDEILRKVEEWENSNVYSAIEKVGEDFDMS